MCSLFSRDKYSRTLNANLKIRDFYPFQFNDAETRVQKIKQIIDTIELKDTRSKLSKRFWNILDSSASISGQKSSEIFFIDCNKLDHSFSSIRNQRILTIKSPARKFNLNSKLSFEPRNKIESDYSSSEEDSENADLPMINSRINCGKKCQRNKAILK